MTDKRYDNIDDLLVKVVLREASTEEIREVEGWLSLDPANTRYFEGFRRIWEESKSLAVRSTLNEEDAWQRFRQRAAAEKGASVINMHKRRGFPWLRIAAALIVLVGGGWLYYTYSYAPAQFLSVRSGAEVIRDTLPEGTVVTLNKQSSIRYQKQFAGQWRKVEMEGEAFFKVTPDKDKPFVVQTGGADIRVIGTSFNVRKSGDSIEVIVETGMVQVTKDGHTVDVRAHEKVVIGKGAASLLKEDNPDDLYNYYRTHAFSCNGIPLARLVEKLNEVYKVHMVIGDSRLRDLPLTSTFRDESLDEILDVITKTLKITYTRKGDEIILQ